MSSKIYIGIDIPQKINNLYEYEGEQFKYYKTCKNPNCTETFFSNSRGQAYCCPDCNKKHVKTKKRRRSVYGVEFKEANRLASRAYDTCRLMAELYFGDKETWRCMKCGSQENIEIHHKSLMILDNRPENLMPLCKCCHSKLHSHLEGYGLKINCLEMFKELMKTGSNSMQNTEVFEKLYKEKIKDIDIAYKTWEEIGE